MPKFVLLNIICAETVYCKASSVQKLCITRHLLCRNCVLLAVWRIQNVLMRIWIPRFKLMQIRIQTCLARERKLFSFKNLHLFFPKSYQT